MQPDDPFAAPASLVADPSGSSGAVSPGVVETLRRTRGWVRFLSILGFIGAGFRLLAAVGLGIFWTMAPPPAGGQAPLPFLIGYSVFLGAMGLLYVVPCIRLHNFASGITRLEVHRDAGALEHALDQQRAFWRFVGISAIALLGFYALMLAAAMAMGIIAAMRGGA